MKFVCLGYADEEKRKTLPRAEQEALSSQCLDHWRLLHRQGHLIAGEALENAGGAKTLRTSGDKVVVTDGPFAETKEQLGGVIILEARDMAEAIELIRKHPGAAERGDVIEIRAVAELPEDFPRIKQR